MHEELKRAVEAAKDATLCEAYDAAAFLATHGDALLAAVEFRDAYAEAEKREDRLIATIASLRAQLANAEAACAAYRAAQSELVAYLKSARFHVEQNRGDALVFAIDDLIARVEDCQALQHTQGEKVAAVVAAARSVFSSYVRARANRAARQSRTQGSNATLSLSYDMLDAMIDALANLDEGGM